MLDLTAQAIELAQAGGAVNIEQLAAQAQDPLMLAYLIGSMLSLDVPREQALLEAPTRLEALRLLHGYLAARAAGAGAAAEDRQPGPDRDEQGAAGVHAPPAAPGHPGRAGRDEPGEARRPRSCATASTEADLPDEVRKEVERELGRLERLPSAAPDYQVTRTYLELVLELPWRRGHRGRARPRPRPAGARRGPLTTWRRSRSGSSSTWPS